MILSVTIPEILGARRFESANFSHARKIIYQKLFCYCFGTFLFFDHICHEVLFLILLIWELSERILANFLAQDREHRKEGYQDKPIEDREFLNVMHRRSCYAFLEKTSSV